MNQITIIGAGTSGLIMAEVLAANGFDYHIIEKKKEKECGNSKDGHVFYFHSDNIQKILPIPLKKITISKEFVDISKSGVKEIRKPTLEDLFQYTTKHTGSKTNSSLEDCGKDEIGYLPKYDLDLKDILFEKHRNKIEFDTETYVSGKDSVVINTSPLTQMKNLIKEYDVDFGKVKTTSIKIFEIDNMNLDKIHILYSNRGFKRATFLKNILYVEDLQSINHLFKPSTAHAIGECKLPLFNKMDSVLRKNILFHLTSNHNIYSLGRYATWSYKRIDHVVDDALDIVNMIRFSQQGRW